MEALRGLIRDPQIYTKKQISPKKNKKGSHREPQTPHSALEMKRRNMLDYSITLTSESSSRPAGWSVSQVSIHKSSLWWIFLSISPPLRTRSMRWNQREEMRCENGVVHIIASDGALVLASPLFQHACSFTVKHGNTWAFQCMSNIIYLINLLSLCFSLELTRASPGPELCGESSPYLRTTLCIRELCFMLDCSLPDCCISNCWSFWDGGCKTLFPFRMTNPSFDKISNFNQKLEHHGQAQSYILYEELRLHHMSAFLWPICSIPLFRAAAINKTFSILSQPVDSARGAQKSALICPSVQCLVSCFFTWIFSKCAFFCGDNMIWSYSLKKRWRLVFILQ